METRDSPQVQERQEAVAAAGDGLALPRLHPLSVAASPNVGRSLKALDWRQYTPPVLGLGLPPPRCPQASHLAALGLGPFPWESADSTFHT